MRYSSLLTVASLLGAATLLGLHLRSAIAAAPIDADTTLEPIVITAERRSENLQQVPLAATALTGDTLQAHDVFQIADLEKVSPALSISESGPAELVNIRGIGLATVSPSATNGVAQYVDGVFQPQIVTHTAFYDVSDVEVLRGPQGTLVGANSTGGAIFINHRAPELDAFNGYAQVGYGNYDAKTIQGAINLPLADTLAVRIAENFSDHDSFYQSVGPAFTGAGRLDEKSGRVSVLWKPGAFQALARVEYTDRNTGGYALRPIPGTEYATFAPPADFTLAYDSPTENYERALMSSLELRLLLSNGLTLRSLSGYQDRWAHNLFDYDATAEAMPDNPALSGDQRLRERDWSQEFNVLSSTEGAFNWLAGGYFARSYVDIGLVDTTGGLPADLTTALIRTTSGVFAQANYHFTPRYEIDFGVRYNGFRVNGSGGVDIGAGVPGFPPQGLVVADVGGHHRDDRPTGKLAFNLTPDERNLLYVFVARGYKPGGYNSPADGFNPESVWDTEAGWKTSLFDRHVRLQAGGFYERYAQFQFPVTEPATGEVAVDNIAGARIAGTEVQAQSRIGPVTLNANAAFVDSHLSSVILVNSQLLPPGTQGAQCPPQPTPGCFDYGPYLQTSGGGPNLYSPKWTFNGGAEFQAPLPHGAALTPRLNYAYLSSQFTSVLYSRVSDYLPARGLLSASLTLRWQGGWSVDAFGTNLASRVYVSGQFLNGELLGAPRQYGMRLQKIF